MSRTPLIPPHEAPPGSWQRRDERFNWKRGLLGAAAGGVIGLLALTFEASAWWWLAMGAGLALGLVNSKSFTAPVLWGRK